MTLCDDCWAETGGYSAHSTTDHRRSGECSRCGAPIDDDDVPPIVDDSDPQP